MFNPTPIDPADAARELTTAVSSVLAQFRGEESAPPLEDVVSTLATYAWDGVAPEDPNELIGLLSEISVAVELLRGTLMSPDGSELVSADASNTIMKVANAANARYQIDEGGQVTMEQLADLAKVTERAVRSATNPKRSDAIEIKKDGYWTFIEAPHALRWLSQRKDFVPTKAQDHRPRFATLRRAGDVGAAWLKWREGRGLTIEQLADDLGWSDVQRREYARVEKGEYTKRTLDLDPQFWRELANHFDSEEVELVAAETYRALAAGYAQWLIAATR